MGLPFNQSLFPTPAVLMMRELGVFLYNQLSLQLEKVSSASSALRQLALTLKADFKPLPLLGASHLFELIHR